jgi:hypothetical protein
MSLRRGLPISAIASLERGTGASILPRIQWEIASGCWRPTLVINKLHHSCLGGEKIVRDQSGCGLEFVGTKELISGRFCFLFSHREQIISACGDHGSDKNTHETDHRRN